MRKISLLCVFVLMVAANSLAQQDPQFTHYMFNTLFYNPGFAGAEGITKLTAIHRSQWLGYSPTVGSGGAPTTQIISIATPLQKIKSGVGAVIVNDQLGPITNLEAQVSYAYHLNVKNSKLSFGVRAGMYSQTINFDLLRYLDRGDPLLAGKAGSQSQVKPDMALGIYWRKEKYYAGVSVNHLLNPTFDFGLSQRNSLHTHMYFTGGYFYEVNFDLKLQLMTLMQTDFTTTTVNLGAIAYFKDTMWGGLSFRSSEAAILMLGYSLLKDKSLKVGYGLDYIIQDQAAKQPTSHELMISYELSGKGGSGKKIVRTPRYRH